MHNSPFDSIFSKSALALTVLLALSLVPGCGGDDQQGAGGTQETSTSAQANAGGHPEASHLGELPRPGDPLFNDINYLRTLPHSGEAELAIGNYWMRRGNPDSAIVHYEDAVSHAPEDANRLNALGLAFKKTGRLAEAKEQFIKASDADPGNAHTFVNLGNIYFDDGELEKAKAQYQLATVVDSTNINGLYNYAIVLDKMGDTKAGIRALYRAINQYPEDPQLREKLGDYYMNVRAYKRAVEQWTEAIGLDPTRDHLRERIAELMEYMREHGMLDD